jgi:hypothetical protein
VLCRDEIAPQLADHVSPAFERLCRLWVLQTGAATRVGAWWGNALNEHRRSRERMSEEIDVVGLSRSVVTLVGECKWTSDRMSDRVLRDLDEFKIPAMRQQKLRFAKDRFRIVLVSKAGFSVLLAEAAAQRPEVTLLTADELVAQLLAPSSA